MMQMLLTTTLLVFAPFCLGSTIRIGVTGDVNLDPNLLGDEEGEGYGYPWGNTLSTTQALDAFFINHEATIANVVDENPNNFQMEDPINYTKTFVEAGVDGLVFANNHQFDYNRSGLDETISQANKYGIPGAGVGYEDEVRKPLLLDVEGVPVALFTVVLINCEKDAASGEDIPHTCTCGINETRAGMMDQQCYPATGDLMGQWLYDDITDEYIEDIQSEISAFRKENPSTFVLTYLHVGPNFQWMPDPTRVALLRGMVDAGSDAVWGTSSHHVQGLEWYGGAPIIYGMGDFLFRHFPGITDYCPDYAVPCEQFRPELSVMHVLELEEKEEEGSGYFVNKIVTHSTRHTTDQVFWADGEDREWIFNTLTELNKGLGGTAQVINGTDGTLTMVPSKGML
ncbi:hypothetical protein TL16_g11472 [Triparma laevis f. inornata]|uniref:Capsule synthesis protein CapA domain-containing protein n=1 Tax=Triparma laevis f. inornata TaxID=1714386 RepID=A0A9W7BEV6_9STRA|nr:hypothetical protein TL16_g11472 [Triparma laevis f. inornata]